MHLQLHSISSGKVISSIKVDDSYDEEKQYEIISGMVDRAIKQSPDIFSVVELDNNLNIIEEYEYE